MTVALSSSDTNSATVPASVTIDAGSNSTTFPVTTIAGPQTVTITATADGYRSSSADLTINGETTLPNVRYEIDPIPMPFNDVTWINGLTNNSVAYGWFGRPIDETTRYKTGWVYDQASRVFYELNDVPSLLAQVESELGQGWGLNSIVGMNESGLMVGYAENLELDLRTGVLVVTTVNGQFDPNSENWQVVFLPNPGSDWFYARRINETGDLVVVYRRPDGTMGCYLYNPFLDNPPQDLGVNLLGTRLELNDLLQIGGVDENHAAFIYDATASKAFTFYSEISYSLFDGLNNAGVFTGLGNRVESYAGGKKTRLGARVVFRQSGAAMDLIDDAYAGLPEANGINDSGDVGYAASVSGDPSIAHAGFAPNYAGQTLRLKELIADDDPLKETFLTYTPDVFAINDRDATGYCQAVVRLYQVPNPDGTTTVNVPLILTPFIPDP